MVYGEYRVNGATMNDRPRQLEPCFPQAGVPPLWRCLKVQKRPRDVTTKATEAREYDRGGTGEPSLVCASCDHPITSRAERIEQGGTHEHTFANPSGMIFSIGCFRAAPGALRGRDETAEFSWFPGYRWSYAVCSICGVHLGWFFLDGERGFYGLILDRLIEKQQKAN